MAESSAPLSDGHNRTVDATGVEQQRLRFHDAPIGGSLAFGSCSRATFKAHHYDCLEENLASRSLHWRMLRAHPAGLGTGGHQFEGSPFAIGYDLRQTLYCFSREGHSVLLTSSLARCPSTTARAVPNAAPTLACPSYFPLFLDPAPAPVNEKPTFPGSSSDAALAPFSRAEAHCYPVRALSGRNRGKSS
jgi:hypothetical protein